MENTLKTMNFLREYCEKTVLHYIEIGELPQDANVDEKVKELCSHLAHYISIYLHSLPKIELSHYNPLNRLPTITTTTPITIQDPNLPIYASPVSNTLTSTTTTTTTTTSNVISTSLSLQ